MFSSSFSILLLSLLPFVFPKNQSSYPHQLSSDLYNARPVPDMIGLSRITFYSWRGQPRFILNIPSQNLAGGDIFFWEHFPSLNHSIPRSDKGSQCRNPHCSHTSTFHPETWKAQFNSLLTFISASCRLHFQSLPPIDPPTPKLTHHPHWQQTRIHDSKAPKHLDHLRPIQLRDPLPVWLH